MKDYKFLDPDDDRYEINIPREVVKDIILGHTRTTYYWSVGFLCFLSGTFFGILIS
jgi:hypothetical protein